MIPGLPPAAAAWTATSTLAAAISYADRGTSAIAASGILSDLGWTEGQLGNVQSSFFLGYGLTQVVGGLLSEGGDHHQHADDPGEAKVGNELGGKASTSNGSGKARANQQEKFRSVLPLSILLTALATLAFPAAATYGGPKLASADRFLLGVFEGLLLPSAMAGVSQLVPTDRRATASSALIAGCYLGSALAYGSAAVLFSSPVVDAVIGEPAWPYVFYVNGLLSLGLLGLARDQFDLPSWRAIVGGTEAGGTHAKGKSDAAPLLESIQDLAADTAEVAKATLASTSGRAILAAQVGQGALLYSIASWGPLFLERTAGAAAEATKVAAGGGNDAAAVTAAAAAAASALIVPQIAQAAVGVGVGTASDALSKKVGTVPTRRALQALSGVVPALILAYLATHQSSSSSESAPLMNPVNLFAAAQTISALSLGAVSVSHLEVAPRNAGTVYALGNVAAAISGSVTVSVFGTLLEAGGGDDFGSPFLLVAALSAAGSIWYAATVRAEPEILVKRRKASS